MPFQNDYHFMLDVLNNRRPARLPVYEHIISPLIMEKILGRQFASLIERQPQRPGAVFPPVLPLFPENDLRYRLL